MKEPEQNIIVGQKYNPKIIGWFVYQLIVNLNSSSIVAVNRENKNDKIPPTIIAIPCVEIIEINCKIESKKFKFEKLNRQKNYNINIRNP